MNYFIILNFLTAIVAFGVLCWKRHFLFALVEAVGSSDMDAADCGCRNCSQHLFTTECHGGFVCRMLCHHVRVVAHGRCVIYGILCFGKHLSSVSSSYRIRLAGPMG